MTISSNPPSNEAAVPKHLHRVLAGLTAVAIVLALLAGGLSIALWRGKVQPVGPATAACLDAIAKAQRGITGKTGPRGTAGRTGAKGRVGPVGPSGATGATGATGSQGVPGVCTNGAVGASAYEIWLAQGHSGSQADFIAALKGEQGVPGATGATGPRGEPGAAGPSGATGATGPKGDPGATGATGATGASGPKGDPGATGATGATGPKGDPGTPGGVRYYGSFYDTSLQTNVTPGTGIPMRLNSTDVSNGVSVVGGTQITVANAGVYNLQFSAQIAQTVSPANIVAIWMRKNGTDVPWTNTEVTLQGNGARYVAAWNFFISLAAGDSVQLVWSSPQPGMQIISTPGNGQPGIPGLILTMQQA